MGKGTQKKITEKQKTKVPLQKKRKQHTDSSSSEDSEMEFEVPVLPAAPKKSKVDLIMDHLTNLTQTQNQLLQNVSTLMTNNEYFKTLSENLQREVKDLNHKVYTLECENERLDVELRKRNLIIFGLTDNKNDDDAITKAKVIKLFSEKLSLSNITIDTTHRISTYADGKRRPIRVQLLFQHERDAILSQRNKLKIITDGAGHKIFINEDLPLKTRLCRKVLRTKLAEAINQNIPAKIDYNRNEITVDGKCFKVVNNTLIEKKAAPQNNSPNSTPFLSN